MRWLTVMSLLLGATIAHAELPSSNDAAIRAALSSGRPTVADFGARTCIPCKKMAPILEELNRELKGKANVTFTDVWATTGLAQDYRVQMIPTQIFFDARGKEVKRHMGFMSKPDILKELKAAGLK
ncbi:MAG: thiol reductase thioredoxin [Geobacteraceae bacterium GWC2_55_20]|nr:MAG: thiol reductase thioredoxin [Geobacteraceae bacterium GWC2_55_20]OGU21075.1 MAG: thiol reductase thioredoxin [Geobacteraceae bacterium GWF2_54_21]HBA70685.1 thioredoxin [Geobacter sp.]HCE67162.1 thioredoxin [Geobacter sp.]